MLPSAMIRSLDMFALTRIFGHGFDDMSQFSESGDELVVGGLDAPRGHTAPAVNRHRFLNSKTNGNLVPIMIQEKLSVDFPEGQV